MTLDTARARPRLKAFDFESLFIEELGWDTCTVNLDVEIEQERFTLLAVAEKRGVVVFTCAVPGLIPPYAIRRKIERQVARSFCEHIIIYVDGDRTQQIWQWVRREVGRPLASIEHPYSIQQAGDSLIQKLQSIAFTLEEEERVTLVDVTGRIRAAFDVERATRRFYDRFKKERDAFQDFLEGIPDEEMERWYVSVMLNRLMFIYFIQKKGFLDSDPDYLRHKLAQSQAHARDCFYAGFLCPLFFQGFANTPDQRSPSTRELLGDIPFLNGGIFQRHELEQLHGRTIQIPDAAFEQLFEFFDYHQWHLDDRPLRDDREINPDVLGYIFEKYINQREMGAYYTKEDITGYISKNTIIPFLFDQAREECRVAFEGEQSLWSLLADDPDRYLYEAVGKGTDIPLPPHIAVGIGDVSERGAWNTPTPEEYALPSEIWRETVARRKRYEEVRSKLASGQVRSINDLITYNLDIQQFAQDVIENCEGPELLRAFWGALNEITVLDPACGSGAFLFAALNILEPLYHACLHRMEAFVAELAHGDHHAQKYKDLRQVLERLQRHPNRDYFVLKSIVINNLYGVDIMAEAVEIAKLRLFLKLVAQIDRVEDIEPLPDIDFNIRSGNTLVGFTTVAQVETAMKVTQDGQAKLMFGEEVATLERIEETAGDVDRLFGDFQAMQTAQDMRDHTQDFVQTKQALRKRLKALEDELSRYLAREYGVDVNRPSAYKKWLASHQPFHWFMEFYGILKQGGFDAIVGNPPYVEYHKIRKGYSLPPNSYATESASNLYAFVVERSISLLRRRGRQGLIVPVSLVCTQRMGVLQDILLQSSANTWHSSYAERPSKLFTGSEVLLTISMLERGQGKSKQHWTTGLRKWSTQERATLFSTTSYEPMPTHLRSYILPKISSKQELGLVQKLWKTEKLLGHSFRDVTDHKVFYRIGGGRYWKIFTTFQPRFVLNGRPSVSSRENYLYFASPEERDMAVAVLSSTLFYWYFVLTTNGRDLNPSDLAGFPISLSDLSSRCRDQLTKLAADLMKDYQRNKREKQKISSRTGRIIYEEFYPRESKNTIDEIDRVLAKDLGFTAEELDFVLNYDIKYRMGDALFEDREASAGEG